MATYLYKIQYHISKWLGKIIPGMLTLREGVGATTYEFKI